MDTEGFKPHLPLKMNKAKHRFSGVLFKGMSVMFDENTVVRSTGFKQHEETLECLEGHSRCQGGPGRGDRRRHGLDRGQ